MSSLENKTGNICVEEKLPNLTALTSQVSKPGRCCGAVAALVMSLFIALSPPARAQDLSFTTATPTPAAAEEENPFAKLMPHSKPIPVAWKIAIVLVAIVIGSGSLWISMRVWRSSNLFDRQYRLPQVEAARLRLGATRSGGHIAVVSFRDRAGPKNGT